MASVPTLTPPSVDGATSAVLDDAHVGDITGTWGYFGVSPTLAVGAAAVGLVAITVTGSFRRWERCLWVCLVLSALVLPRS